MDHQAEIGNLIIIGCLFMLGLGMVIVLFYFNYRTNILKREKQIHILEQERQIAIFKAAVEAEEKQKERIANNLHDEVIPLLAIMKLNTQRHFKDIGMNKFEPESLKDDTLLVEQCIAGIRSIAMELIPGVLLNFGLVKAMEQFVRQVNRGEADAEIENKTGFEKEVPFSKNDQVSIYRIYLEILNNLQKHARYTYLKVTLDCSGRNLSIGFRHDGKGITDEEIEALSSTTLGLGLKSMQSRLLILNASLHYAIETDTSLIQLSIPFGL